MQKVRYGPDSAKLCQMGDNFVLKTSSIAYWKQNAAGDQTSIESVGSRPTNVSVETLTLPFSMWLEMFLCLHFLVFNE